ncbi:hypothetical protein PTKU46_94270 [Paraburkholderia terrae]
MPVYRLLMRHLAQEGYVVIQSTSPHFAPHAFWTIISTLHEAGAHT